MLGYKSKLHEVDEAIIANADFLKQIVANPEIFGHGFEPEDGDEDDQDRQRQEDIQDPEHQSSHTHGNSTCT